MKLTGIVRTIDNLGRIVIPKDIRQQMDIQAGDILEICLDENTKMVGFQKVKFKETDYS